MKVEKKKKIEKFFSLLCLVKQEMPTGGLLYVQIEGGEAENICKGKNGTEGNVF